MAEERLSKLQKWVLVEAYKNHREHETSLGKYDIYELYKRDIYERFFGIETKDSTHYGVWRLCEKDKVKAVILSRSLKRLKEKGYVEGSYESLAKAFGKTAHCTGVLCLTDKGVEIAKSIITVTVSQNYTIRVEPT